ncbi:hypothetical protein [Microbacterium terrisoli]|jgi:hypothetical protein|uniref:hypothetical protein n=1 Tax=Microbacterium terrisoli TaxID=3242192 RepID=UPI0028044FFA|nr:hypothetical protein [Microbacterium protaetiae]
MEWTRTDAARRRIVVVALIIGPLLAALSAAIGLGTDGGGMREQFASMGAHAQTILVQDVLETAGFLLVLAALAGATQALRLRGGTLGTIGAILAILGTAGFSISNATGLAVVALAQQPNQDAAFQTAMALTDDSVLATAGTMGFVLELLAQAGMLLVMIGLVRARLVSAWVLTLPVLGIAVNAIGGMMAATLVADLLLLAAGIWIAVRIARCSRQQWLGNAGAQPSQKASPRLARSAR